ncbi:MAG TPA: glycosyltransferase [Elusimicrobiota bacterium]|nr:glycosyltransferase [Elusimicrobiota bacterium]
MPIPKRILFLYIAISSGHQRAAEAVMMALHQLNPHIIGHGVDSFTYAYPVLGPLLARLYLEMLQRTPQIWDYLYDNTTIAESTKEIRELLNIFNNRKLFRLFKQFHPRAMVCTQAFPASIVAALKRKGKIRLPLIGIVTDYEMHTYWLSKEIDLFLVGSEDIKRDLIGRGVRESKILVTGIPIDPHFAVPGDKVQERKRLGLNPTLPTALVMGGSRGLGPLEDVVQSLRTLQTPLQVLVVCGQNKAIYKKLRDRFKTDHSVRVFGYSKTIPRLMDAADLLISKPGGLTCAESLAKGLPLVMISPIPGQEERNARYLLKHGAAVRADNLRDLQNEVRSLLTHRQRFLRLQERQRALAKPRAAYDAAEAILRLMGEPVLEKPWGGDPENIPPGQR